MTQDTAQQAPGVLAKRNGTVALPATNDPIRLGEVLAASGYFQDARDAAKAAVKVMAGQELGFGPIASMTGIHIIDGKPSIGANLLAALVKRSPNYSYKVREMTAERCVIAFFENGEELEPPSEFTVEDAKRAGLLGRRNWQQYPKNMLFARALSNGVTFHCPDLCMGAPIYTPDELGAEVDGATGEVVSVPPAAPSAEVARPRTEVRRPSARPPEQTEEVASPDQRRLIFARAKHEGLDESQLKAVLKEVAGTPHTDRLPKAKVDEVLAAIKKVGAEANGSGS
jgi:hypothetical protein